jgi:hypothetical protein
MASLVILDNAVHITEHPDAEIAPTRVPGNSGKTRSLNSIETEQPIPPRNGYVFAPGIYLHRLCTDMII